MKRNKENGTQYELSIISAFKILSHCQRDYVCRKLLQND